MADYLAGVPDQNANRADALGQRSASAFARSVVEFHRDGLRRRRLMDLTAEKYAIHIDAEGDGQWADIYDGQRIVIPPVFPGQMRRTENLLRPVVDNAVAYHTTMPFRFVVEAKPDREAKARAVVDQAVVNHMATAQKWNRAFAEAMQIAMPAGSCPVHAFWRNDLTTDPYEPAGYGSGKADAGQLFKGFVDTFVGDPWDTVHNTGAKRNSRHVMTWARTVPLSVVVAAFPQVAAGLKGSTRLPSASRWQRTMRLWAINGLETHGSAAMRTQGTGDELIVLLCREQAPGYEPDWPQGRLTLVAVQGSAAINRDEAAGADGQAVILHDGPLPAGRFSDVIVYSANRFDDIHGKPFVGDLDDLQVALNQALSARTEYLRRSIRPPLVSAGFVNDTASWEDDAQLEVDPSTTIQPYYLQLEVDVAALNAEIAEIRQAMYTIGGYQAASRGEANPGDAASKVKFLSEADDTIHGPTNQRFRETVEDYAKLAHALFREYADVPWLVDLAGNEYAHLTDSWVDRSMVSQEDPSVKLISGAGATVESKITMLSNLVMQKGADGEPLMTTKQFRAAFPDQSVYPAEEDVAETRQRRARVISAKLRRFAREMEQQMGPMAMDPIFLGTMHQQFLTEWPYLPDDDAKAHFDALSSITQDEFEGKLARELAKYRQAFYQQQLTMLGMIPPSMAPLASPMGPQPSTFAAMQQMQAAQAQAQAEQEQTQRPGRPAPKPERPAQASTGDIPEVREPAPLRG